MDLENFRKVLLAKERELSGEVSRFAEEGRDAQSTEVEDTADEASSDELKATAFEESTLASETLAQVRAALDRIKRGEYGRCIDCGREIGPSRLEAVPWTPYCLDDQQKHDAAKSVSETTF